MAEQCSSPRVQALLSLLSLAAVMSSSMFWVKIKHYPITKSLLQSNVENSGAVLFSALIHCLDSPEIHQIAYGLVLDSVSGTGSIGFCPDLSALSFVTVMTVHLNNSCWIRPTQDFCHTVYG